MQLITKQLITRGDLSKILSQTEFVHVKLTCDECLSTKEKADRLNRSIDTINSHMKNIFKKLNISKVTELSKIYFTSTILFAMFTAHGLVNTQIRSRVRIIEPEEIAVLQSRLRTRRREKDMPLSFDSMEIVAT